MGDCQGQVVGVGCYDFGGGRAVSEEEVEEGGRNHRSLRDTGADDAFWAEGGQI